MWLVEHLYVLTVWSCFLYFLHKHCVKLPNYLIEMNTALRETFGNGATLSDAPNGICLSEGTANVLFIKLR